MEQQVAPTPADGGGQDESARYQELQKEYGDAPAASESAAPAEKPAEAQAKPPLPYEELENRYRNLQSALHEARGESRAERERLHRLEAEHQQQRSFLERLAQLQERQRAEQQRVDEDPYLAPVQSRVESVEQKLARYEAENRRLAALMEQREEAENIARYINAEEARFSAQVPDYHDAIAHLRSAKQGELEALYPDTPQMDGFARQQGYANATAFRQALMVQEVHHLARHAAQVGMSPAELAYNIARQRGYTGRQAAPARAQAAQPTRIDAIREGQRAPASLSTGAPSSTGAAGIPSVSELADMYLTDPDRAAELMARYGELIQG